MDVMLRHMYYFCWEQEFEEVNLVSGQAEKSAEKSDVELSNERPLMNIQQEIVAPSNTILLLHNPLQQPLQMGKVSTKQCFLFAFNCKVMGGSKLS